MSRDKTSAAADKRRFLPEPVKVWLGSGNSVKEYDVTPAPWAVLFKLKDLLHAVFEEVTELWNQDLLNALKDTVTEVDGEQGAAKLQKLLLNENLWALIDQLLQKPEEFFKLAIPDIDPNLFADDNRDGITIPQVWATFEVIARVNRLDLAKNVLGAQPVSPK